MPGIIDQSHSFNTFPVLPPSRNVPTPDHTSDPSDSPTPAPSKSSCDNSCACKCHAEKKKKPFEDILACLSRHRYSIGDFLEEFFTIPPRGEANRTLSQMASKFLDGSSTVRAPRILDLMYNSRYSVPKETRGGNEPKDNRDRSLMARHQMEHWAIGLVEGIVRKEADALVQIDGGLRMANKETSWDKLSSFSLGNILQISTEKCPTLLRLLRAAADCPGPAPAPPSTTTSQPGSSSSTAAPPTAVAPPESDQSVVEMLSISSSLPSSAGLPPPLLFGNTSTPLPPHSPTTSAAHDSCPPLNSAPPATPSVSSPIQVETEPNRGTSARGQVRRDPLIVSTSSISATGCILKIFH